MKNNPEFSREIHRPEAPEPTEDEKIDTVAADVLKRYRKAFEELAK